MERLPSIKWYLIEKSESLKKRVGGWGKQRQLGMNETNTVEKTWKWSCGCWNDRIHLKRSTPVGKELTWQPQWSRRISTPIEIWERLLEKVWNQHLTSKQLEYHNWKKQNKRLACKISQNKHMIEISSEVFVVGPKRARSYSTIMYKGSAHDIRSVPEPA